MFKQKLKKYNLSILSIIILKKRSKIFLKIILQVKHKNDHLSDMINKNKLFIHEEMK